MLARFEQYLYADFPNLDGKQILVAISGGVDSVVLSFLLKKLQLPIVLAHCNFQLRGDESNADEQFVRDFAQKHKLPLHVVRFDTQVYIKEKKLNTQLAARELRYNWFEQIAQEANCQYIATGHQADDNLETFIINLSRGTGLSGLVGIPKQNGNIIRPLLNFSRKEIITFATKNNLLWREDSSNASDKYVRNQIRHHISPKLKKIHSEFLNNFLKTQQILYQTQQFIVTQLEIFRKKYFTYQDNIIYFDISQINENPNKEFIIFELMKEFHFTNTVDLKQLLKTKSSGKQLFSSTHRIIQNRNEWIISPLFQEDIQRYVIPNELPKIEIPISLSFEWVKKMDTTHSNTIFVDADTIEFPLQLRKKQEQDVFAPFGMQGKKKKLSKFFKDEKYSLLQKENQWLLTDATNAIIWIIGMRADHRFRITSKTRRILKITTQL